MILFICLVLSQASHSSFFFEVEDYAISTFFVLLYIATAYTSLDRRSVPFAAGLSLGLALTFSMSTAFLLPSFAWLTLERVRAARKASSTTGPVTTGLVAVASIASPLLLVFGFLALVEKVDAIALYRHSHLANYRVYMRLYGAPESTLSLQHMTDVLQLNVLVAPFSVLLSAIFLPAAARYGALSDAFFRFCAALTLCAWVFLIFWIPGFPMRNRLGFVFDVCLAYDDVCVFNGSVLALPFGSSDAAQFLSTVECRCRPYRRLDMDRAFYLTPTGPISLVSHSLPQRTQQQQRHHQADERRGGPERVDGHRAGRAYIPQSMARRICA